MKRLKPTREQARQKALWLFTRTDRPVLVGHLALELAYYSLDDAESVLLEMVRDGLIRPVTEAEKKEYDIRHGFMLV